MTMKNLIKPLFGMLALMLVANACTYMGGSGAAQDEKADNYSPPPTQTQPIMVEAPNEEEVEESIAIELADEMSSEGANIKSKKDEGAVKHHTEEYSKITDNPFFTPTTAPLSTFSIDVDGASYTNCRSRLNYGQMPYKDMVRIEEFINYFDYEYPDPKGEHPFEVVTEVSQAPWNPKHQLVHIGLQGKKLNYNDLKPSNLVFLLDVSGSMEDRNKLPLLRSSLK